MGSSEKFCLRWNDFESNISVAFREIREEKDFFDITLSCGSRQIQAHKLILSACSPFFRTVLKQNPHQHPLLFLKGVEFNNLQSVLNFMYHGEVNIAQEELNSFLAVAEELQVKGLTQNNSTSNSNPKHGPSPALVTKHRPPPREPEATTTPKRSRPPPVAPAPRQATYPPPESDDIQEIIPMPVVKTEPQPAPYTLDTPVNMNTMNTNTMGTIDTTGTDVANMEDSYVEEVYDDYGGYDGQGYQGGDGQGYADQQYEGDGGAGQEGYSSQVLKTASGYVCAECGKEFTDQSNARRHAKNSHNKVTGVLSCEFCQRSYKNNDSLRDHQRKSHGLYKQ